MLKRKHIRAPASYKPPGRAPTEHLVYLNPHEEMLVRALTDGTAQRGPKGIPSYAVTTGKTTTTTGGSSGGPGGGELQAPNRTAPSSDLGGGGKGSGGSASSSSSSSNKGPQGAASASSSPSSSGGASDASSKAAPSTQTAAAKAPASTPAPTQSTPPSSSGSRAAPSPPTAAGPTSAPARTAPSTGGSKSETRQSSSTASGMASGASGKLAEGASAVAKAPGSPAPSTGLSASQRAAYADALASHQQPATGQLSESMTQPGQKAPNGSYYGPKGGPGGGLSYDAAKAGYDSAQMAGNGSYYGPKAGAVPGTLNDAARKAAAHQEGYYQDAIPHTPAEASAMGRMMEAENGGVMPGPKARLAVGDVIANRTMAGMIGDKRFKDTVQGNLDKPGAFSATLPGGHYNTTKATDQNTALAESILNGETPRQPEVGPSVNYGNLSTINNPRSVSKSQRSSRRTREAFNSMPQQGTITGLPGFSHTFGTIGRQPDIAPGVPGGFSLAGAGAPPRPTADSSTAAQVAAGKVDREQAAGNPAAAPVDVAEPSIMGRPTVPIGTGFPPAPQNAVRPEFAGSFPPAPPNGVRPGFVAPGGIPNTPPTSMAQYEGFGTWPTGQEHILSVEDVPPEVLAGARPSGPPGGFPAAPYSNENIARADFGGVQQPYSNEGITRAAAGVAPYSNEGIARAEPGQPPYSNEGIARAAAGVAPPTNVSEYSGYGSFSPPGVQVGDPLARQSWEMAHVSQQPGSGFQQASTAQQPEAAAAAPTGPVLSDPLAALAVAGLMRVLHGDIQMPDVSMPRLSPAQVAGLTKYAQYKDGMFGGMAQKGFDAAVGPMVKDIPSRLVEGLRQMAPQTQVADTTPAPNSGVQYAATGTPGNRGRSSTKDQSRLGYDSPAGTQTAQADTTKPTTSHASSATRSASTSASGKTSAPGPVSNVASGSNFGGGYKGEERRARLASILSGRTAPARRGRRTVAGPQYQPIDWSYYTNVVSPEDALRQLLGKEWFA